MGRYPDFLSSLGPAHYLQSFLFKIKAAAVKEIKSAAALEVFHYVGFACL